MTKLKPLTCNSAVALQLNVASVSCLVDLNKTYDVIIGIDNKDRVPACGISRKPKNIVLT